MPVLFLPQAYTTNCCHDCDYQLQWTMEGVPSSFIPTCFLGFYGGLDLSLEASRRVHHKSPNLVAYVHFLGDYAADLLRIADFFTRAIWGYLGIILGHPGAILGPSWGHLGPSWAILGPSWAILGPAFPTGLEIVLDPKWCAKCWTTYFGSPLVGQAVKTPKILR